MIGNFVSGRVSAMVVTSAPAYVSAIGGFGYDSTGQLLLYYSGGTLPAAASFVAGIACTSYGAVCVRLVEDGAVIVGHVGGLPVTAIGEVVVDSIAAIGANLTLHPLTTAGALAIDSAAARSALTGLLTLSGSVANYQLGVGLTGPTNASAWANQIGAAGPLLQVTATNQPAIQADGSLLFDGVDNFMQAAFTLNQPTTIYFVGKQVTWTDLDDVYDGFNLVSMLLVQATSTPSFLTYAGASTTLNGDWALNTNGVITSVFNGASSTNRVDSSAETTGNAGASNGGGFTLGSRSNSAQPSNIQVKEIIIRNVADSAATQAQIRALLKAIHGTP